MAQSKTIGVNVVGRVTKLEEALNAANRKIAHFAKQTKGSFTTLTAGLKGLGPQIAAAFGFQQLFSHFSAITKHVDELNEASKRLGASTTELSAWAHAAKLSGVEFGELASSFQKFVKNLGGELAGDGKISERLASMGLNAQKLTEIPLSDSIRSFADAFKAIPTLAERNAVAFELFGRSGGRLVEFFSGGAAGLDAMIVRAKDLGITFDELAAGKIDSMADSIDDLRGSLSGLGRELAVSVAPAITATNKAITANISELRRYGLGMFGLGGLGQAFGLASQIFRGSQSRIKGITASGMPSGFVGPPSPRDSSGELVGPPSILQKVIDDVRNAVMDEPAKEKIKSAIQRTLSGLADPRSFLGRIDAPGGAMMTIDKAQLKAAQESSKTLRAIESMIRQFQKTGGLAA